MKAMLYTAVEEAPAVENVEEEILKRHFSNFDENFFHYCMYLVQWFSNCVSLN
jgi:hypothetical protein